MNYPVCRNTHNGLPFVDCPKGSTQSLREIAEYITRLRASVAELEAERDALRARLDAIEAAKVTEPAMPEFWVEGDLEGVSTHGEDRFEAWGRLGWDTAAALKVERDCYRNALETIAGADWNDCGCYMIATTALEGE